MDILIIDDDKSDLLLYSRLLSECETNYNVHTAYDAQAALKLLKEKEFGCIFIDQNMPEMTGMEILHELRSAHSDVMPVVILTGHRDREIRAQAAREGAMDFIVKDSSITSEQLDSVVQNVVKWAKVLNKKDSVA